MTHDQAALALDAILLGERPERLDPELAGHVAACADCDDFWDTFRTLSTVWAHPSPVALVARALDEDETAGDDAARVEAHLDVCPPCADERDRVQRVERSVAGARSAARRAPRHPSALRRTVPLAAAGFVGLLLGAGGLLWLSRPAPTPPGWAGVVAPARLEAVRGLRRVAVRPGQPAVELAVVPDDAALRRIAGSTATLRVRVARTGGPPVWEQRLAAAEAERAMARDPEAALHVQLASDRIPPGVYELTLVEEGGAPDGTDQPLLVVRFEIVVAAR